MNSLTILMYHQVGEFAPMRTHRATYCHVRNFCRQMAYLRNGGYSVLPLDDAVQRLVAGQSLLRRAVALTFDDGYSNFYEYAAPILERYQFPATVYLLSRNIGGAADWLAEDDHPTPPLMLLSQIRELQGRGISFGSHGRTHRRLSMLSAEEAREEIALSKTELEAALERPVHSFCYPYGATTPAALTLVREAGYDYALSCVRGRATVHDDSFMLPRMAVSYGTSLGGFWWKLHAQRR